MFALVAVIAVIVAGTFAIVVSITAATLSYLCCCCH